MNRYYFKKDQLLELIVSLKDMEVGTEEFRRLGSKIICSFSKHVILSEKGVERGLYLWNKKVSGEEITREELFELSLIGNEAAIMTDQPDYFELANNINQELYQRYNPEDEYMESLIMDIYLPEGFYEENENFVPEIHAKIVSATLNKGSEETNYETMQ